jgi:hypothetical protein
MATEASAMSQTIDATYDGQFLRPDEALPLAPNTRVRVTVQVLPQEKMDEEESVSFLDVAASLNLDAPRDLAKNLDKYLYGDPHRRGG